MCYCMFYGMMWQSHAHDMMISPHAALVPSPACMQTCKFDMHAHALVPVCFIAGHTGISRNLCAEGWISNSAGPQAGRGAAAG